MALTNTNEVSTLYAGDGVTTDFATVFAFQSSSDLAVYTVTSGTETLKTLTTHYTVTGGGPSGGNLTSTGTVVMVTAPASGTSLLIVRATPRTQATVYTASSSFPADSHANALDKLTMETQALNYNISRAPAYKRTSTTMYPQVFPDGGTGKEGYVIRYNTTNGNTLEAASPAEASLDAVLTPTDGGFVVGDGTNFVVETGATARTSMGLGSIATQASSSVTITGGSITGITDIAVADGGTGASTASGARTNLGVVIGTDVQAYDAELAALAGLTSAADKVPYFTGSGTAAVTDLTAAARTILDDATVGAIATTLGLGTADSPQFTGVNIGHASDTTVTRTGAGDIAVEGNLLYRAGGTDVPVTDGGTGASSAGDARTNLGLVIGTHVQAYDAELAALAGLTSAADKLPYFTGSGTADVATFTAAARTVVDDATVAAMVDTLGGASSTGTGGIARATSPTFVTPVLGAATATSINGITLTAPTTTVGAKVVLPEGTDNGAHTLTIKPADSMAASYTIELPADVPGGNGYTLAFTTGGVASFVAPGSAAAGGASTNVQFNTGGALDGDSGFIYSGSGAAILTTSLTIGGNATAAGKVIFKEDTDNGSNTCTLSGPQSTGDVTITLPASTGTVVLQDNAVALTAKTGYNSAVITAPTTTVGGNIKLLEGTDNGTNTITLQAPASTADVVATFQAVTGTVALSADIPAAAAQSDQETATSTVTYVSPGRQQFHPSAAKFWTRFTGITTTAITSSYNTNSVTDNGTGLTTVTIETDFSGTSWMPIIYTRLDLTGTNRIGQNEINSLAAGTIQMTSQDGSSNAEDNALNAIVGFGDQ